MTSMTVATRPPKLPGTLFMGSATELRRDALGVLVRARRDHGDVVHISAGPPGLRTQFYGIFHPDGVHRVLADRKANYRKDNPHWHEMRDVLGNGLVVAQDEDWLSQRRALQPLFTPKKVNGYAAIMAEEVNLMLGRWRAAEDGVVDLHHDVGALTLQVIGRILFGNELGSGVDTIQTSFPVLSQHILSRGLSPIRIPQGWPTPGNRRMVAARRKLYAMCDQIISGHRARTEENSDFVGLMMQDTGDGATFDNEQIRDQVLVFLLAGHDTTASALTFALHLLALHPEHQDRAYAEVSSVLGDRDATADDMAAMPFVKMVLKETMRLYPSIPLLSRYTPTGDEIGGYTIPPRSAVWTVPWVTHRHPEFWPDPERFDPDRFQPEAESTRHRYAWYPFGAGPRSCIGQHLSMLELTVALAGILNQFELKAVETDIPVAAGISLATLGDIHCVVSPRHS